MSPRGGELRPAGRFLRGLGAFARDTPGVEDGRRRLERQLEEREAAFTGLLRRTVFEHPASPYRRLFAAAGVERRDVETLLAREGLDTTLARLYDAGVYVTLEEFKGARPLIRPGLEAPIRAEDFDNPLTDAPYEARTGGSSGPARRIFVDLRLLAHESAYHASFLTAAGVLERPVAIWHPAPPASVGIKTALIQARLGRPAERWFSQSRPRGTALRHALFTGTTVLAARAAGARLPRPRYTPPQEAGRVAAWLARKRAEGTPATLFTTPSACVRACAAALDRGLDLAGTFFVVVGEPYTASKQAVVSAAGGRAACHYAMVESGLIGVACLDAPALDDVHLALDKIATVQRLRPGGADGGTVGALFHTTLLAASPKVMLNVESGDYGLLEERDCGCGAVPVPFRRHLHSIRSYEKLTSEGANFVGEDVLTLVERVLPGRFGGLPTDYQFVEREEGGLPRVSLVVGGGVGELDRDEVVHAVLEFLHARGETIMAGLWARGRTLELVRGEPHVTPGGKTLPLQTLRAE